MEEPQGTWGALSPHIGHPITALAGQELGCGMTVVYIPGRGLMQLWAQLETWVLSFTVWICGLYVLIIDSTPFFLFFKFLFKLFNFILESRCLTIFGSVVKNPFANARDLGDSGSISGLRRFPGGGNGNPLQYSCLGNPMDRGAWQATVQGVAKSQTRLNDCR